MTNYFFAKQYATPVCIYNLYTLNYKTHNKDSLKLLWNRSLINIILEKHGTRVENIKTNLFIGVSIFRKLCYNIFQYNIFHIPSMKLAVFNFEGLLQRYFG